MTSDRIYLDYNASAPLLAEARDAMSDALSLTGNASSVHAAGRAVRRMIEQARERIAGFAGATPEEVIFTSGATEANNLALRMNGIENLIISAIEHDSVQEAAKRCGLPVTIVPVSADGAVDPDALRDILAATGPNCLVSIMAVNNETGVIQPIGEIAAICREAGATLHCDAVQAAGRLAFDFLESGVDMVTLSAHKIGGPSGSGCLIVKAALETTPLISGGGQERNRRAGTENVAAIAGFGAAVKAAAQNETAMRRAGELRDKLESHLRNAIGVLHVHGSDAPRVGNTSNISMPGVSSETQIMAFDLKGICVSAGSACSSGKVSRSRVLEAMGVDAALCDSAIRISLGPDTTEQDIDSFARVWLELYERHAMKAAS